MLGATPGADAVELRRAWKALVRTLHPDQARGDRADTSRKLAEINDALDTALAWARADRARACRARPTDRPARSDNIAPPKGPAPQSAHDHAAQARVAPHAVPVPAPVPAGRPTGHGHDAARAAARACFLEARRIFAPGPRARCLGVW